MSKEDLIPLNKRTKEEQKTITTKGGIASGKARREKKLMSQIYSDFLVKKHKLKDEDGKEIEVEGHELLSDVMSNVLSRSDSASVSLMKEIRDTLEGSNVNIKGDLTIEDKFKHLTDKQLDDKIKELDE